MKDDLSFSFNDVLPPKRNFKVGKFQQRTYAATSSAVNETPTDLYFQFYTIFSLSSCPPLHLLFVCLLPSFLSRQSPFTFFSFFPLSSFFSPSFFFPLTFLTTVRNPVSQVRRVISHWVHILLVLDPFCVVIVYSFIAAFYVYLSTTVSPPRVLVYHVLSTEILRTPFEPHLFACLSACLSFREPVLQNRPSSRSR